jgi:hypothetical protein
MASAMGRRSLRSRWVFGCGGPRTRASLPDPHGDSNATSTQGREDRNRGGGAAGPMAPRPVSARGR